VDLILDLIYPDPSSITITCQQLKFERDSSPSVGRSKPRLSMPMACNPDPGRRILSDPHAADACRNSRYIVTTNRVLISAMPTPLSSKLTSSSHSTAPFSSPISQGDRQRPPVLGHPRCESTNMPLLKFNLLRTRQRLKAPLWYCLSASF